MTNDAQFILLPAVERPDANGVRIIDLSPYEQAAISPALAALLKDGDVRLIGSPAIDAIMQYEAQMQARVTLPTLQAMIDYEETMQP